MLNINFKKVCANFDNISSKNRTCGRAISNIKTLN